VEGAISILHLTLNICLLAISLRLRRRQHRCCGYCFTYHVAHHSRQHRAATSTLAINVFCAAPCTRSSYHSRHISATGMVACRVRADICRAYVCSSALATITFLHLSSAWTYHRRCAACAHSVALPYRTYFRFARLLPTHLLVWRTSTSWWRTAAAALPSAFTTARCSTM